MSNLKSVLDAVRASKGPIGVQRLSLKVGKDLNKLMAESAMLDAAVMGKVIAEARALGVQV